MLTFKWFLRLLVWNIIVLRDLERKSVSKDLKRYEFVRCHLYFLSLGWVIVPVDLMIFYKELVGDNVILLFSWCFSVYLLLGIIVFFTEKVTENVGIPWQNNGRW